jgi:hypothetical protein
MIASRLRALPLLLLAALPPGCGGVTSRPIDPGRADGGTEGDGLAPLGTLAFEEDGTSRSGLPAVTAVVLVVNQTGVQLARVVSLYDAGGASLGFEVQRVAPPVTAATYTCGPGVAMWQASPQQMQMFTGPASDGRCTVTFTELGTRPGERVAGTFSAVLRNASGTLKIITDGTFAIPVPAPED